MTTLHHRRAQTPDLIIRRPIRLLLIKQIRPRTTQIYNLGTPIAIFLETCTFEAVKGVADAFAAADDAFVLVVSKGALIADANESCGTDVGIADGAFAVTFVAEAADCYAGLFAAHDEIAGNRQVSISLTRP